MNVNLITQIVGLLVSLGPLAVKGFLQLESVLNLSSDEKANIAAAIAASDKADDETIAHAAAWLAANSGPPPVQ